MRARLKPTAVGLLGLLAQGERDAEATVVDLLDFLDQMGDFVDKSGIAALAALQRHRSVAQLMRQLRTFNDLLVAERVTLEVRVLAAHAAIEAIFGANVAIFNQPAQVDEVVQVRQLHLQSLVEQQFLVVAFGSKESLDFLMRQGS